MRYVSTFSGIEAASVAWDFLGWEPMAFCEIDQFPSAVLAERYPDVPNLGDMTKVDWRNFAKRNGKPDLLVGGSPCQASCDEEMSGTLKCYGRAPIAASPAMVVRRLTPTECERLQGFPDGWTKIPYKGNPAEECPDGPRYKAIGNSMAVPVMRWIGERIDMFERGEIG